MLKISRDGSLVLFAFRFIYRQAPYARTATLRKSDLFRKLNALAPFSVPLLLGTHNREVFAMTQHRTNQRLEPSAGLEFIRKRVSFTSLRKSIEHTAGIIDRDLKIRAKIPLLIVVEKFPWAIRAVARLYLSMSLNVLLRVESVNQSGEPGAKSLNRIHLLRGNCIRISSKVTFDLDAPPPSVVQRRSGVCALDDHLPMRRVECSGSPFHDDSPAADREMLAYI
jgi:hypothetical protein